MTALPEDCDGTHTQKLSVEHPKCIVLMFKGAVLLPRPLMPLMPGNNQLC